MCAARLASHPAVPVIFARLDRLAPPNRLVKHIAPNNRTNLMSAQQFVVQGGHRLSGTIRPSGNKNAALPIVAAALLCRGAGASRERPAHPRRRDARRAARSPSARTPSGPARNALDDSRQAVEAPSLDPDALPEDPRVDPARRPAARALRRDRAAAAGRRRHRPPARRHALPGARAARRHVHVRRRFILDAKRLRGADVFLDEPSVTAHRERPRGRRRRRAGRPSCATPRASRTCRISPFPRRARRARSRASARTRSPSTAAGRSAARTYAIGPDHIEVGSFIGLAAVTDSEITHRATPASSICARRSWASSGSASSAASTGDGPRRPGRAGAW